MKKKENMKKKTKNKVKTVGVSLSVRQIQHLVEGALSNAIDVIGGVDGDGLRFFIVLECLSPDDCIPADQEPEDDDEMADILCAHGVCELSEFIESVQCIHRDGDEEHHRAIETVKITQEDIPHFLNVLAEIDSRWEEVDNQIEEDNKAKLENKNLVAGNGIVN